MAKPRLLLDTITLDPQAKIPLYRQLYRALRQHILDGRLPAATRLPSSRTLAQELELSRNTVVNAYEQLIAEGYLHATSGSGTVVAATLAAKAGGTQTLTARKPAGAPARLSRQAWSVLNLPTAAPELPGACAFTPGIPDFDAFPKSIWARLLARRARGPAGELANYGHVGRLRPFAPDTYRLSRCLAGRCLSAPSKFSSSARRKRRWISASACYSTRANGRLWKILVISTPGPRCSPPGLR